MSLFINNITSRGAAPALEATLAFNHAKLTMLAENVANFQTPHYRTKQLDTQKFQRALREALDQRKGRPDATFDVQAGRQVRTEESGRLQVTPSVRPPQNVLFHDGTNQSIETQMSDLAETGMMQNLVVEMLKGRFDGLRKSIRGSV